MNGTQAETTQDGAAPNETEHGGDDANGWEWAIVEIFGRRRHIGRTREEERFGAKMLRVDIPVFASTPVKLPDGVGPMNSWIERWETHYYGGASIFSYTLTDEATALRLNKPYELPRRYLGPPDDDQEF